MKLAFVLGSLSLVVVAFGTPPQDVAGMKFQHNTPGVSPFDGTGREILLNADGTYTGLNSFVWRQGTVAGGTSSSTLISVLTDISIPGNGRWTYRVVDSTTAEIVLDGNAMRLLFDEGKTSGRVDRPNPGQGLQFASLFWFFPYNVTTRMANCSTRSYVASRRSVSFGFVITEGERRVLIRAVGPGLRAFGITQPLENPVLSVFEAGNVLPVDLRLPSTTRATLDVAAQRVGAFPLQSPGDQGKFLTLNQGAYVAEVVAGDGRSEGEVLIEVYQLP